MVVVVVIVRFIGLFERPAPCSDSISEKLSPAFTDFPSWDSLKFWTCPTKLDTIEVFELFLQLLSGLIYPLRSADSMLWPDLRNMKSHVFH